MIYVTAKTNFLNPSDDTIDTRKQSFKTECLAAVAKAKDVLAVHRGWKQFWTEIASFIANLFTGTQVKRLTGRVGWFSQFPTETDSLKKLKALTDAIEPADSNPYKSDIDPSASELK